MAQVRPFPLRWKSLIQNSSIVPFKAQIVAGFVSFGVLHIPENKLAPWQWYMLITGIVTLFIAVSFWLVPSTYSGVAASTKKRMSARFLFPDNPQTAWFLTPEEKILAVKRIKSNNSGIENKTFKKEQCVLFHYMPVIIVIETHIATGKQDA